MKAGQVYEDSHGNRHVRGDSTSREVYELVLKGDLADLILADPPYCLLTRRNKKTGALRDPKKAKINHEAVTRFRNVKEYRTFTQSWMDHSIQVLSPQGYFIIWTNFLGKSPIVEVAKKLGLHFIDEFKWGKLSKEKQGNEVLVRLYEVALIFSKSKKGPIDNTPSDYYLANSIISHYDEDGEASEFNNHPNHKPFTVLEPLIKNYSRPGQRVLDPFTGSGSTPAAAVKLNRVISGIELLPEWAKISQLRLGKIFKDE